MVPPYSESIHRLEASGHDWRERRHADAASESEGTRGEEDLRTIILSRDIARTESDSRHASGNSNRNATCLPGKLSAGAAMQCDSQGGATREITQRVRVQTATECLASGTGRNLRAAGGIDLEVSPAKATLTF